MMYIVYLKLVDNKFNKSFAFEFLIWLSEMP